MTRQQTQVAMKLLDKVLPSLRSVSNEEAEPEYKPVLQMTDREILTSLGEMKAEALGKTYQERGYIHRDDLEKMGYVRREELVLSD